jgi:Zn-dependent protease/CBS domain-containing protein
MGVVAAILFFLSILLHELSHSLVARWNGIPIRGITLFLFGGVAEMAEEPPSAWAEFTMALAGPVCSLFLSFVFVLVCLLHSILDLGIPRPVFGVARYLAVINGALAVFNLVPGFPLDGGRVLRAFLWYALDNLRKATRIASTLGLVFGALLIAVGLLVVFYGRNVSGLWLILIGAFLRRAAHMGYKRLVLRSSLQGITIGQLMKRDVVTVEPGLALDRLVEDYFFRFHFNSYPVVRDGRLLGLISLQDVKPVPRDQWPVSLVQDVMDTKILALQLHPMDDATAALEKMLRKEVGRLPVTDEEEQLVGIVTRRDIMHLFRLKADLGGGS